MFSITIILLIFSLAASNAGVTYENFKVFNLLPKTDKHLELLRNLTGSSDKNSSSTSLGQEVKVLISPEHLDQFYKLANSSGIEYHKFIDNVEQLLQQERSSDAKRSKRNLNFDLEQYHKFKEIHKWLRSLEQTYHELGVKVLKIGSTIENRPILGIYIPARIETSRSIVIEAGIHAREWISTAVANYFIDQFIRNPTDDPGVDYLAESYNWYIFPTINPDGYTYTWTTKGRYWRKNRASTGLLSKCDGVDLNRNWEKEWRPSSTKNDDGTCNDAYSGPNNFSEKETQAMRDFLLDPSRNFNENLVGYIALHSYARAIIYPYTFYTDGVNPKGNERTLQIAERAVNAIRLTHHQNYIHGYSHEIVGQVFGSSIDWVKDQLNPKYTFAFELRPEKRDTNDPKFLEGFELDPRQIVPVGEEIMAGLISIFHEN